MKKTGFLIIFLGLSLGLHFFFLLFLNVEIDTKKTPVVYSWPNIVDKNILFSPQTQTETLPNGVFSLDKVRRDYFYSHFPPSAVGHSALRKKLDVFLPLKDKVDRSQMAYDNHGSPKYFYLWDQIAGLPSSEVEKVTYNIFVSSYGKVLLIYPDKLAANSSGNFLVQDHIRSASFFINDNFFWTKMEGVVK